ncbi:MAG: hypothetical protein CSB47_10240 [Proteobacteria bacterium]|nr:MAG: hypothetical protein CSB47_10240 [Pseudomonadota bacterium]
MSATRHRQSLKVILFNLLAVGCFATDVLATTSVPPPPQQAQTDKVEQAAQRFYKIGSNSERLADDSKEWACVEDTTTQLFWQKRDPASDLHDVNEAYRWYQPEHNNPGQPRSNPELPGIDISCYGYRSDDPATYCNTHAFIQRVNQSNYCGFDDWRLPTIEELLSLSTGAADNQPALDLAYFPFYDPFAYWTRSVNQDGVVLTVIQGNKVLSNSERSDHILVRLVRGASNAE